ncbi:hypothetical protein KEM48_006857 [Puccinia striiformis f. sp. tritici PST-130]|nr:hypothetical protein KEM48_006857 [Puccinia striiformis f. sp. tritici PST-130]
MSLTGQMLSCLLFKIPLRRRKPLLWIGSCLPVPPPHHRYQPLSSVPPLIVVTSPSSSVPPTRCRCRRYHPLVFGATHSSSSPVPPTRRRRQYHPLVVGTACSLPVPPARCRYRPLLSVPGSLVSTLCRRYHTSARLFVFMNLPLHHRKCV